MHTYYAYITNEIRLLCANNHLFDIYVIKYAHLNEYTGTFHLFEITLNVASPAK